MTPVLLRVPTGAPGVRAAFTTRRGGVSAVPFASLNLGSTSGDDPDAVRANRAQVAELMRFDAARAVTMRQVHGARVARAMARDGAGAFTGSLDGAFDADACVTTDPGVALLAMGADCPVILAWRRDGSAACAIHAGWRGLVAGVVPAALQALGVGAHGVRAAIGPHVGPCCYPVDDALRAQMARLFGSDVVVGDAVDLGLCAERALCAEGLAPTDVARAGSCTCCATEDFFSYRRDGAATGRQAAIIVMGEVA